MLENYSYIKLHKYDLSGNNLEQNIIDMLCANGKEKTAEHIINVANTCVQIAEKFGLNKEKSRICGILHDISAMIHPDDMMLYAARNNWYIDESEKRFPFILHQRISRVIAEEDFKVTDEAVLSAIKCHSTLQSNPSDYDMVLFLADKLSWDQEETAPFYDIVLNALKKSLAYASHVYIKFVLEKGMILYPHKWFTEAKEWLDNSLSLRENIY